MTKNYTGTRMNGCMVVLNSTPNLQESNLRSTPEALSLHTPFFLPSFTQALPSRFSLTLD